MRWSKAGAGWWLVIGLALAFPTNAPAQTPTSPPLRVGVLGPFSGSSDFIGAAMLKGVLLAVEETNAAGGVRGQPVNVVHADDGSIPERAAAVVRELFQARVVAIIGPNNSSCTLAVMDQCARQRVPLLTADATATALTARGNRWLFRCIESDSFRLSAMIEYLAEGRGVTRLAAFHEDDDFGNGLLQDLNRILMPGSNRRPDGDAGPPRLEVVTTFSFQRGHEDFRTALQAAAENGASALGLFGITADNLRIAATAHELDLSFQLFVPGINPRYTEPETVGLDGLVSTDSFFANQDRPVVQAFMQRFLARFGEEPGSVSARSYDAAQVLLQAMATARTPRGTDLRDALSATENHSGLTGRFNFNAKGDVIKPVHLITLRQGRMVIVGKEEPRIHEPVAAAAPAWWVVWAAATAALAAIVGGLVLVRRRHRGTRAPLPSLTAPLSPVRPVVVNPYIVGNPIRERDMFFGREDDFEFIRKNISRPGSGVCLVICGDRRSGKTSILYQLLNGRLGDGFVPLLADLQMYGHATDAENFFDRLARDIHDGLARAGVPPVTVTTSGRAGVEAILAGLAAARPGERVLLLFDEYEILEGLVRGGSLPGSVVPFLAGLLERYPGLSYVLTGSSRLEDRDGVVWEQLIGKSLYRKISFLTEADTLRLIQEPLAGRVVFDAQLPPAIYRLTAGQPFYTQAVCMALVDLLNEEGRNRAEPDDLGAVVEQLAETPLPQMLYFWDNLTMGDRLALSLLAECLDGVAGGAAATDLLACGQAQGLPELPAPTGLQTTLGDLVFREILLRRGDRFEFRVDLMREWIRRDRSPWQVIGAR